MQEPEFISTSEAAKICGVARTTITRWIDEGSLKAFVTPGGHRKIIRRDLLDFLARNNLNPTMGHEEKKSILVVDDNEDDLKLFEAAFLAAQDRFQIHTARDGFEAVYKIGELKPDIVILDLMMPKMNGFEVCSRIKSNEATRHMKVIITTAHGEEEIRRNAIACAADAFYTKPLDWADLIRKILELSETERHEAVVS